MNSTNPVKGEKGRGSYTVVIVLSNGVKLIAPDFKDSWDARDWIAAVSSREKYKNAKFRIIREEK